MGDELNPEPVDAPAASDDTAAPLAAAYATVRFPNTGYVLGDLEIGSDPVPLTDDQLTALKAVDAEHIVSIEIPGGVI